MAQTDARAGFRLPWNTERSNSEQTETDVEHAEAVAAETEQVDAPASDAQWGTAEHGASTDPETPTGEAEYEAPTAVIDEATETATSEAAASNAPRKPQSKFMTDLTKAMQVAAEEARGRTLAQFQAEAKAHVEQIHARSATEAEAAPSATSVILPRRQGRRHSGPLRSRPPMPARGRRSGRRRARGQRTAG